MGIAHRTTITTVSAVLALLLCSGAAHAAVCGDTILDPGSSVTTAISWTATAVIPTARSPAVATRS